MNVADAKEALVAARKLLDVSRTDLNDPKYLDNEISNLVRQRSILDGKIDCLRERRSNLQDRYDDYCELVVKRTTELVMARNKAKIERFIKMAKELGQATEAQEHMLKKIEHGCLDQPCKVCDV